MSERRSGARTRRAGSTFRGSPAATRPVGPDRAPDAGRRAPVRAGPAARRQGRRSAGERRSRRPATSSGSAGRARESRSALKLRLRTLVRARKPTSASAACPVVHASAAKSAAFTSRSTSESRYRPKALIRPVSRASWPSALSSSVLSWTSSAAAIERAAPELDGRSDTGHARGDDHDGRRHAQPREEEDERVRERPEDLLAQEFRPATRLARTGESARRQERPLRRGSGRGRRRACPTRSRAARRAACRPRRR